MTLIFPQGLWTSPYSDCRAFLAMALQLSFWLLLVAVVHSQVFSAAVNAELAFVKPNSSVSCTSSQQRPCLTFNEYAQQVDQYFVDNTTFLFLPGTHELDAPLNLKDLSNVSFAPSVNDLDAQILLSPSANITWTNREDIEISGFVFILSGQFSVLSNSYTELVFHNTSAVSELQFCMHLEVLSHSMDIIPFPIAISQ